MGAPGPLVFASGSGDCRGSPRELAYGEGEEVGAGNVMIGAPPALAIAAEERAVSQQIRYVLECFVADRRGGAGLSRCLLTGLITNSRQHAGTEGST